MLKRIGVVLLGIWLFALPVQAQNQTEEWALTENCLGELNYPVITMGRWDFPGTIITGLQDEGVRGLRADRQTEYFIAQESDDSYPSAGALSPDGLYYLYPTGYDTGSGNMVSDIVALTDYRVARTDGLEGFVGEFYLFEVEPEDTAFRGNWTTPGWLGSEVIFFYAGDGRQPPYKLFDFKQRAAVLLPDNGMLDYASPDGTRVFINRVLYDVENGESLSYEYDLPDIFEWEQVVWFADSSAFLHPDGSRLAILNRDGELIDEIMLPDEHTFHSVVPSPDGKYIGFVDNTAVPHLIDLEARTIENLCLEGGSRNLYKALAWSPDSRTLALTYQRYLVLVDMATRQNRVIDHQLDYIVGWADAAPDGPATPIPPSPTPTPTVTPTPTITLTPTITPTPTPSATPRPASETGVCVLTVITGANLRSGAGVSFERVGSAAVGFTLEADAQQYNSAELFTWWRLTTGEWIREDFTTESIECESLPEAETSAPGS